MKKIVNCSVVIIGLLLITIIKTSCQKPNNSNIQNKAFDSTMILGKWFGDSELVYKAPNFSGVGIKDTTLIEENIDIKANGVIYSYAKSKNVLNNSVDVGYDTLNYIFDKNLMRFITSRKSARPYDENDTIVITKITNSFIIMRNMTNKETKEFPAYLEFYGHK